MSEPTNDTYTGMNSRALLQKTQASSSSPTYLPPTRYALLSIQQLLLVIHFVVALVLKQSLFVVSQPTPIAKKQQMNVWVMAFEASFNATSESVTVVTTAINNGKRCSTGSVCEG